MTITKALKQTTKVWLQGKGYSAKNLDQQGDNGTTALVLASREREIDIVQDLLSNGVDINLTNNDGNNALWFACFRDYFELMELLINAGINLNNQNDNGVTVLMYAASSGKAEAVKLLLAAGANPNLRNLDDFRAIEFSNTVEIFNLLRNH
ncbi:ankyrin repeat-containing protein [Xenococcus sp. PCC 7305]|uniref:ankyrin repeat domain-containing protein n=1 Tax=Xenococcus sp. PCC 7305 TaxID=102125 RepID=UPI0002ACF240|nr:ankyrin repeat domain-containing protein [Xenococcus sp. PCC 7305]ELS05190.1 ankyrin repeat-containing protein [Xenococcus sp. PCC 7305]